MVSCQMCQVLLLFEPIHDLSRSPWLAGFVLFCWEKSVAQRRDQFDSALRLLEWRRLSEPNIVSISFSLSLDDVHPHPHPKPSKRQPGPTTQISLRVSQLERTQLNTYTCRQNAVDEAVKAAAAVKTIRAHGRARNRQAQAQDHLRSRVLGAAGRSRCRPACRSRMMNLSS